MPKRIETIAMEEIFKQNMEGFLPVLVDIFSPDIKWQGSDDKQENCHLRLVNDTSDIVYKGKTYAASCFNFTPPTEDGKKIEGASITISAIDQRVIELIRLAEIDCKISIVASFAKQVDDEGTKFYFTEMQNFTFTMKNVTWNRTTAQWTLVFDETMQLNIPRDLATEIKCPSCRTDI